MTMSWLVDGIQASVGSDSQDHTGTAYPMRHDQQKTMVVSKSEFLLLDDPVGLKGDG
jgi:hypothetical protein